MKRFLSIALIFGMILTAAACGNAEDTASSTPTETTTEATAEPVAPSVNEGEFKAGVYTGTSSYSSGEMNMTWNFVLTFQEDGTFVLTNDAGEDKGAGTYALADDCYIMNYSDERTCTFVVQKNGTLKMTADFPYGMATIQLGLVGDIVFTFESDVPAGGNEEENNGGSESTEVYTLEAGTYTGTYEKVSAMAGTVLYNYTATIGEDGTFSYAVTFAMGDTTYDGSSASGTYTIEGNAFTFTDTEGNVNEGTLTADNTLAVSLKASQMASTSYDVTLTAKTYSLAAGTYEANYEKVSAMAGTVIYDYIAKIGADGTFSYAVTFAMGGTPYDGASASGTYKLEGNTFIFTDSEGTEIIGKLTADNTLVISLQASSMAPTAYEIMLQVES